MISWFIFCLFLVAGGFEGTSPVGKSHVRKQSDCSPESRSVFAVVGTEEMIRELVGLDRRQDQTWCPQLGRFVATLALLDLSPVLFFALG